MLHAVIQGKTKYYRQYLGVRADDGEKHIALEDELTSTFLGPQAFMTTAEVYCFWKTLLEHQKFPDEAPKKHMIQLWPSRKITDGGRVEPDAHLTFEWENGTQCILLIEFKWKSGLSGEDQLRNQWLNYLSDKERKNAIHIFIGFDTGSAILASNLSDIWNGRLIPFTWLKVRELLNKNSNAGLQGLTNWASATNQYLEKIGVRKFEGFSHLLFDLPFDLGKLSSTHFFESFTGFKGTLDLYCAAELPETFFRG